MATTGDRSAHFPAIERRYGQPMAYWFDVMEQISDRKYPEQIAYLRENYGFSQTHANALVQYSRGSLSSRRFETLDDYLAPLDEVKRSTVIAIIAAIRGKYRSIETVIAWNHPQLKYRGQYVFGVSVLTNYLLIAPWGAGVIDEFRPRLEGYKVNKKTIQVPIGWTPDKALLRDLVAASIATGD